MLYTRCYLWLFAAALFATGCVNPPEYPDEPIIAYEGASKDSIFAQITGIPDSIVFQFSFTDGDGDLSSEDSTDIFYVDSRFPNTPTPLALPPIPREGTGNGISGDVFFTLINTGQVNCVYNGRFPAQDPAYPLDTFSLRIYMLDQAGNQSNTIQTDRIQIKCFGR
ncbi:MAG: hypothetical protein WA952_09335 [Lewinella sp.]